VTVIIIVDDDETIQEVPYGGSAEMPSVPDIPGKKFIGWDKSFVNITEDTTITAIFEDDNAVKIYHTVTICIADKTTSVQVEDGKDVPLPSVVNIEGYTFKGWDKDYRNVKQDMTISAILEKKNSDTVKVTFIIYGMPYEQVIEYGGTAIPPFTPTTDLNGNSFIGWDKGLSNITSDTVINAVFGARTYTVTFIVDGVAYPVTVQAGNSAIPPSVPEYDSLGRKFVGWDGNFLAVSSDMTINAIYQ
ncbi:MAG: InlB B-repeat-containing protein, partial [Huintestinicola sp.]